MNVDESRAQSASDRVFRAEQGREAEKKKDEAAPEKW